VELDVGSPRCGKRITLSRPIIPLSAAASLARLVEVDFAEAEPDLVFLARPTAGLLALCPGLETLSLGPDVTAGTVDEVAAVVSAADCAEGRHPISAIPASIIETFVIRVINCSWSGVHGADD
jgi:hypothetical protein